MSDTSLGLLVPLYEPQFVSEIIAERKAFGESAASQAIDAMIKADERGATIPELFDAAVTAILNADLSTKKGIGVGKHGFGEKDERQFKQRLLRVKQGMGK